MKRDIKFRAYDGTNMVFFNQFELSNTGGFWGGTREVWAVQSFFGIGKCQGSGYWHSDFSEEVEMELMQYTGLKDKNGKDIYEGDVLDDGGVVEYFDNLAWDGGGSIHSGYYCKIWFLHKEDGELDYGKGFEDVEVIGNIHENPELIKDQH